MERLSSHQDSDDNRKLSPDFSGGLRSGYEEKRELACDSYPSVGREPNSLDAGVEENQRAMPGAKYAENRPVMERDEIGDVPPSEFRETLVR